MTHVPRDPNQTYENLIKLVSSLPKRLKGHLEPSHLLLDPISYRNLQLLSDLWTPLFILGADGKPKWNGMPIKIEYGGIKLGRFDVEDESAVSTDSYTQDQILTIEYTDRRSGRITYLNHPDNPEGYN